MLKFSYFVATIKNIKTRAKQRKKKNQTAAIPKIHIKN